MTGLAVVSFCFFAFGGVSLSKDSSSKARSASLSSPESFSSSLARFLGTVAFGFVGFADFATFVFGSVIFLGRGSLTVLLFAAAGLLFAFAAWSLSVSRSQGLSTTKLTGLGAKSETSEATSNTESSDILLREQRNVEYHQARAIRGEMSRWRLCRQRISCQCLQCTI